MSINYGSNQESNYESKPTNSFPQPAVLELNRVEDYLSPEQRWDAIAAILSTIGLRVMRQEGEPQEREGQECEGQKPAKEREVRQHPYEIESYEIEA